MQKQLAQWNRKKTKSLVFLMIALYLLLFLPFWVPVLLGFLFAAAFEPIVNRVRSRLHTRRTRVAYATVAIGLTVFIGLFAVVILQGYSQIYQLFQNPEVMTTINDKIATTRDQIVAWASHKSYLSSVNIGNQVDRAAQVITDSSKHLLLIGAQKFIAQAPVILLDLTVFLMAFGAFLVIQPRMWAATSQAFGLGDRGKEHFQRFEKICGLALGSVFLTGFIQSLLVVIGAALAGYSSLVIIFGVTFIFALIPVLGAGLVPTILAVVTFIQGDITSGIIMTVTAIVVGTADNILRAWLFSRAAKSNPVISLISLLGGIALLGFAGLFVAPVLEQLVMTYAFSDEGEPLPSQVTPHKKPISPDAVVEHSAGTGHDMVPRPT